MWLSSVLVLNSSRANAVSGKTALRNAQDVCLRFIGLAVGGYVMTSAALAQQLPQPQQPLPPTSQQQPTPVQPSQQWQQLPHMQLERQFAGPLRDTVIQRWRDPADGTVCYIYLPITVQHSAVTPEGFVQYGANPIGSISCAQSPPRATARPLAARSGAPSTRAPDGPHPPSAPVRPPPEQ